MEGPNDRVEFQMVGISRFQVPRESAVIIIAQLCGGGSGDGLPCGLFLDFVSGQPAAQVQCLGDDLRRAGGAIVLRSET